MNKKGAVPKVCFMVVELVETTIAGILVISTGSMTASINTY